MTDCPHCDAELAKIGKKYKKKHEIIPIQRRYKGGVLTSHHGFSFSEKHPNKVIPEGSMKTDECKSCHWKSVWRLDGPSYDYGETLDKKSGPTWRLIESGLNIDVKGYLKKYGFRR